MPPVKMYTLSNCSHCKNTKLFLKENGIKYEYVDVDLLAGEEMKAMIEEVKKYDPACTFPTIRIGNKVIVGFKRDEIKAALGI